MTIAEEIRRKYALTSFKAKGATMPLIAVNEVLEAAAKIADEEQSPIAASRIRSLKWAECTVSPASITAAVPVARTA
jgi:hypothetical protein